MPDGSAVTVMVARAVVSEGEPDSPGAWEGVEALGGEPEGVIVTLPLGLPAEVGTAGTVSPELLVFPGGTTVTVCGGLGEPEGVIVTVPPGPPAELSEAGSASLVPLVLVFPEGTTVTVCAGLG
jgi:hypothetical protein